MRGSALIAAMLLTFAILQACQTGDNSAFETDSSTPITDEEEVKYKQSLIRCHKTGGTRVVKMQGNLRCF